MPRADHDIRFFSVHPSHGGPGHIVQGVSFEDAALSFVETWRPDADDDGDVSVVVRDHESGHEHCFLVDVSTRVTGPCE